MTVHRTGGFSALFVILGIASARAQGDSTRVSTTRAGLDGPAIAAGPNGYAVAWGERHDKGGHLVDPKMAFALLDPKGKTIKGPRYGAGLDLHLAQRRLIWNGHDYTVVACAQRQPANLKSLVVWGHLDGEAGFHESGRVVVDGSTIVCNQPQIEGDKVILGIQMDGREGMDLTEVTPANCYVRFVALGDHEATPVGKDLKLCTALARGTSQTLGTNHKNAFRLLDDKGKASPKTGVKAPLAAARSGTGTIVLDVVGDQLQFVRLDPTLKVEGAGAIHDPPHASDLRVLRPDLVAIYDLLTPRLEGAFAAPDGTIKQKFEVTLSGRPGDETPSFLDLAARPDALACAYLSGKDDAQDVYVRIIPAPTVTAAAH